MNANPLDMAGHCYRNWGAGNDNPPIILNPKASVHACIAWCWGEAAQAHELVMMARSNDTNNAAVLDSVLARLDGLERMLDYVGERTRDADGAGRVALVAVHAADGGEG